MSWSPFKQYCRKWLAINLMARSVKECQVISFVSFFHVVFVRTLADHLEKHVSGQERWHESAGAFGSWSKFSILLCVQPYVSVQPSRHSWRRLAHPTTIWRTFKTGNTTTFTSQLLMVIALFATYFALNLARRSVSNICSIKGYDAAHYYTNSRPCGAVRCGALPTVHLECWYATWGTFQSHWTLKHSRFSYAWMGFSQSESINVCNHFIYFSFIKLIDMIGSRWHMLCKKCAVAAAATSTQPHTESQAIRSLWSPLAMNKFKCTSYLKYKFL